MRTKAPYKRYQHSGSYRKPTANDHLSTWKTDNAGTSNNDQVTIPTEAGGTYACWFFWGDGTSDYISAWNDAALTHTYPSAGTYQIKIKGQFEGFVFNNGGDCQKLISIDNGGKQFRVGNSGGYFYGCAELTHVRKLITTGMTTFYRFFRGCAKLVSFDKLDSSSVTTTNAMFLGCTLLNEPNVGRLDMRNVTNTAYMMYNCTNFNQYLYWTTSSLLTMSYTFQGCAALDQSLSHFDISSVSGMVNLLTGATSFSNANYSAALIAWNAGSHQNNVQLDCPAQYEAGAAAARTDFINNHGWTINDGGAA